MTKIYSPLGNTFENQNGHLRVNLEVGRGTPALGRVLSLSTLNCIHVGLCFFSGFFLLDDSIPAVSA